MNYINQRLQINMQKRYDHALARFEKAQDTLLALDTERIIARGYGILRKDEEVISSVTSIAVGDALDLELQDGQIEVEVKNVKQKTNI